MPIHNKLVRDQIPEIIEKSGKNYSIETLDEREYIDQLKKKLQEEVNEYLLSQSDLEGLEELADILEVIYALSQTHQSNPINLENIRKEKAERRGGFQDRIFLIKVEDE